MRLYQNSLYNFLSHCSFYIIEKAYDISKKVRKLHKEYINYKKIFTKSSVGSYSNINMYMKYMLDKYKYQIHFLLFIFDILTQLQQFVSFNDSFKNTLTQTINLSLSDRKLIWIQYTLKDLDKLQANSILFNISNNTFNNERWLQFNQNKMDVFSQNVPYEFIGLIPRSITRTLSRFQKELLESAEYITLPEFRFAKFQAFASFQYIASLILIPWGISNILKVLLQPWIYTLWNIYHPQIFISISQEEKALNELQNIEDLLWLEMLLSPLSSLSNIKKEDVSTDIYKHTINVVQNYNQQSIQTIIDLIGNLVYISILFILLILGKKRLSILNSWIQEVFYSLSDTMKSFFILLLTDLCIGFHSPHGWEILIQFILDKLGITNTKHIVSCFVSTFPVILDTVFKYWIFRHLNRISPSIVVNYHAMNE